MVRTGIIAYGLSLFAILVGLFSISLYFIDFIPGQPTKGVLFFLRMGASLMIGLSIILAQVLLNTPQPQRAERAEIIGMLFVLAVGILLSMLLLPQMYAGTTWGP